MTTNQGTHLPAVFNLLNSRGQYEARAHLCKTHPPPQSVHISMRTQNLIPSDS